MSQNFIKIFQVSSEILAKNYNVVKVGKTLLAKASLKCSKSPYLVINAVLWRSVHQFLAASNQRPYLVLTCINYRLFSNHTGVAAHSEVDSCITFFCSIWLRWSSSSFLRCKGVRRSLCLLGFASPVLMWCLMVPLNWPMNKFPLQNTSWYLINSSATKAASFLFNFCVHLNTGRTTHRLYIFCVYSQHLNVCVFVAWNNFLDIYLHTEMLILLEYYLLLDSSLAKMQPL